MIILRRRTNGELYRYQWQKAELTDEQLEKLGIKTESKNPFERVERHNRYWYIGNFNNTIGSNDARYDFDNRLYNDTNYFNDENFAKQIAWHEELNRKLLKFAYDHKAVVDWTDTRSKKYYISYDAGTRDFIIESTFSSKSFNFCFASHFIASKAYNQIVEPFMAEHPEFVW